MLGTVFLKKNTQTKVVCHGTTPFRVYIVNLHGQSQYKVDTHICMYTHLKHTSYFMSISEGRSQD